MYGTTILKNAPPNIATDLHCTASDNQEVIIAHAAVASCFPRSIAQNSSHTVNLTLSHYLTLTFTENGLYGQS